MQPYFGIGSKNPVAAFRYDMALRLLEDGDVPSALSLLSDARQHDATWPPIHFYLGEVLRLVNRHAEAQESFDAYLQLDPNDAMGARIKLSFMDAHPAQTAMSMTYIQTLFDQYAPQFEQSLLGTLCYQTPCEVSKMVEGRFESVLDLGCGTGLAAQEFSNRAREMEGVDLSQAMLDIAKSKNIYTQTHLKSMEDYLAQSVKSFDLVLCLDVLIYVGNIAALFGEIAKVMKAGGLFVFSTQSLETGQDMVLGQDHRYAHSNNYIEKLLKEARLDLVESRQTNIRKDNGVFVKGYIYISRKEKAGV